MKRMKLPILRKSKTSEIPQSINENAEVSSFASSSTSSSALDSQSTSLTVPSTKSSTPLSDRQRISPEKPRSSRPKSELFVSRRLSGINITGAPKSPLSPRIISIQEGQWVHQSVLLVFGQVGSAENRCKGYVTVHHHLDGYPATQWPLCEGYFKALVRLDAGPNDLRFEYNASKIPSFSTNLTLNMLPLTASPPLHLILLVGKDSTGEYDCSSERNQHDGNGIDMAVKKLRMAAYLGQAFTGEQIFRKRLGRRCFRLEEEWCIDTLSNRGNGTLRNVAKVHIVRTEKTVNEIRKLESSENGSVLREIVKQAVTAHFGNSSSLKQYFAVTVVDAMGDLQVPGIMGQSAFDDGLGIIGGRYLYALPSCIEEVVLSFSDCTRLGTNVGSTGSRFFWEAATTALGTMIEAFLSPQTWIEPRNFMHINRTFVTKESYSLKTKSQGLSLSLPDEECTWPRLDCIRFRYHPCFRLPTDPMLVAIPDTPQVYAIESGLVAGASTGIALILIYADGVYRDYLEYTAKPCREVILGEELIRSKIPDLKNRKTQVKFRIFSAGQGEAIVADFAAARQRKVKLPNGFGSVFKSTSSGLSEISGSKSQELILHTVTTGRLLTAIRVYHNSSSLDGLEFLYEDTSSQLFGRNGLEGGITKSTVSNFALDARKGEMLVGFSIRSGHIVDGIEILTSFGRRSSFFGNSMGATSSTLIPPRGCSIAGISGTCADCVDGFSILYK